MSTLAEIEEAIENLQMDERWQVLEHTRHLLEPEIPASFRQAMHEIDRGDTVELDAALLALDEPK